jgi:sugar phosphate isomerase/epimerase
MSLELGCNTLYPEVPRPGASEFGLTKICRALENIAACGFQAAEFSHILHLSDEDATAAGECCRSLGLMPWSAHAGGSADVGTEEQRVATLRDRGRCLEVSHLIGVRVMVYHIADYCAAARPLSECEDLLALETQVLRQLAEKAEHLNLRIALENAHDRLSMQYLVALVEAVDNPAVGICVDTGHAALGDLGPTRAIRMSGARLYSLHLQDNWGRYDDHLPPGCGGIDWCAVTEALAEVEYHGVLELELTDAPGSRPYHQELEMRCGAAFGRRLQERVQSLQSVFGS